jgi:hypothetical protein
VSPLYLDFVEVLICRYDTDRGFVSARRDPIRNVIDVIGRRLSMDTRTFTDPPMHAGRARSTPHRCVVDGVHVIEVPLSDVVEDLAHAIVADRREGRRAPKALDAYVHLFAQDASSSIEGFLEDADTHRGAAAARPSVDGVSVARS